MTELIQVLEVLSLETLQSIRDEIDEVLDANPHLLPAAKTVMDVIEEYNDETR